MDINSMTNLYSSLYNQTATDATAEKLKNTVSGTDYSGATEDELMDVCKQFESYFLEQVFKQMMSSVNFGGVTSDSSSSSTTTMMDYYKDMFVQEMAKTSTENQSTGLAQMLYEQMKRNYDI